MATSEGIPSSIDIEFLELNDNPKIKVKIATRPKSSFVKYLERIERRRIWTSPFVIVDIVVHPIPLIISFLLNLSDIIHHKTVEDTEQHESQDSQQNNCYYKT